MREAFGGTFMIKLILIFIVIYISFMAVAIDYAKVFRVKNNVINILEQNQFVIGDSFDNIDTYLNDVPYNENGNNSVKSNCDNAEFGGYTNNKTTLLTSNGVCIKQLGNNTNGIYYKVTAYISIEFPFFNLYFTIPISGETKVIRIDE